MPSAEEDLLRDLQRRTRELEALYETAGDLSALRDVDQVLEAIVRRSRQLLSSDVAYLLLLDDEHQEAYMRVGDGIQTQEFLNIRLAFGEGIAGLVATTGMPLWTSDYSTDEHLAAAIDSTVKRESLVSILGVPLAAGGRILGVLLASDRRPREFTHEEVALLSSLAHHAAIALENASLFQDTQRAVARWQEASARVEQQNVVLERAAEMHERLTRLVLEGAPVSALAETVASTVGGEVVILDAHGAPLTNGTDAVLTPTKADLDRSVRAGGHAYTIERPGGVMHLVAVQAGARKLGYLLHRGHALDPADIRALERASMVTALLLLDRRAHEEARVRSLAQVFTDLTAREEPDMVRLRRRAQASGITLPDAPVVAAVCLAPPADDGDLNLDMIALLALKEGWLARVEGRQVSLVVHATNALQAAKDVQERLADGLGEKVTVGAAGPGSLTDARDLLVKAHTCAKVLETTGQYGAASTPEELGVYALLLSDVGRDRIDGFVTETIGPVQDWDRNRDGQLTSTLEAYFEHGGQTGKLAEALFVHVNTLYQRLERIDRLLGPEWRRGERALQVHLAVRLARLLSTDT